MTASRNDPIDPYKVLGVSPDAATSQIKTSYRRLALKYHPDRRRQRQLHNNDDDDDAKFAEIAAAYAILSDPAKKREYDHLRRYGAFDSNNNNNNSNSRHAHSATNTTTTATRSRETGVGAL